MGRLGDQTGSGKIQDGGLQTSNARNPASRQDINEIPTAMPMFRGLAFHWDIREDYATQPEVEKSKMVASELRFGRIVFS